MFPFLTTIEVKQMRLDFERLLASPEATCVKMRYYHEAPPSGVEPVVDEVYKRQVVTSSDEPIEATGLRCIHDVPSVEKLVKYPGGFIKEGESILYFSHKVNLQEPMAGYPVIWDSLLIIDALQQSWKPKLIDGMPAAFHHLFRIGKYQIAQAVACRPEK